MAPLASTETVGPICLAFLDVAHCIGPNKGQNYANVVIRATAEALRNANENASD